MTSKYTQIGPIVEGKYMETMCNCVDNMTFAATQRTIKTKAVVTREVKRFVKFAIKRIRKEFKPKGFDGLGRIDLCDKAIELVRSSNKTKSVKDRIVEGLEFVKENGLDTITNTESFIKKEITMSDGWARMISAR